MIPVKQIIRGFQAHPLFLSLLVQHLLPTFHHWDQCHAAAQTAIDKFIIQCIIQSSRVSLEARCCVCIVMEVAICLILLHIQSYSCAASPNEVRAFQILPICRLGFSFLVKDFWACLDEIDLVQCTGFRHSFPQTQRILLHNDNSGPS